MRDRMGNAILVKETRALFGFGVVRDWPDREILERFLTADRAEAEAAFGVLVQRHGPMVLHVCRQVLVDAHDAQDAFQATFLVFLRRAGSIRNRDSLASWLFGVALRVSRRARYAAILRRFHEKQAGELAAASSPTAGGESATMAALHEEIARLPERFREPIVICHLEGLSTAAAAQRLRCSQGTILSRLSRARERLRRRMTGRGLAVPAGILVASAAPQASAGALPAPLLSATVAALWPALAGPAAVAKSVTPSVELLTRISLRALLMTRITCSPGRGWAVSLARSRSFGPWPSDPVESCWPARGTRGSCGSGTSQQGLKNANFPV
jgi:RNA polymerase sigma factor (sigma-70 family)